MVLFANLVQEQVRNKPRLRRGDDIAREAEIRANDIERKHIRRETEIKADLATAKKHRDTVVETVRTLLQGSDMSIEAVRACLDRAESLAPRLRRADAHVRRFQRQLDAFLRD